MTHTLTVALIQIASAANDPVHRRSLVDDLLRQAADQDAQIALFPEMWLSGYPPYGFNPADPSTLKVSAIATDSELICSIREACTKYQIGAGITYLEDHPGGYRNTISLIGPTGEILCTYAKVHTCAFDWEGQLIPGDGFCVIEFPLADTDPVRIAPLVCMDREFPEAARVCMLAGAEMLLIPNACELEKHRLHQIEARAFENMTAIAVANYPAPQENGHSVAYSPIAFDDNGSAEMVLCEAGGESGIYLAHFDMDAIRDYRAHESWGPNFRHPRLYGAIASYPMMLRTF